MRKPLKPSRFSTVCKCRATWLVLVVVALCGCIYVADIISTSIATKAVQNQITDRWFLKKFPFGHVVQNGPEEGVLREIEVGVDELDVAENEEENTQSTAPERQNNKTTENHNLNPVILQPTPTNTTGTQRGFCRKVFPNFEKNPPPRKIFEGPTHVKGVYGVSSMFYFSGVFYTDTRCGSGASLQLGVPKTWTNIEQVEKMRKRTSTEKRNVEWLTGEQYAAKRADIARNESDLRVHVVKSGRKAPAPTPPAPQVTFLVKTSYAGFILNYFHNAFETVFDLYHSIMEIYDWDENAAKQGANIVVLNKYPGEKQKYARELVSCVPHRSLVFIDPRISDLSPPKATRGLKFGRTVFGVAPMRHMGLARQEGAYRNFTQNVWKCLHSKQAPAENLNSNTKIQLSEISKSGPEIAQTPREKGETKTALLVCRHKPGPGDRRFDNEIEMIDAMQRVLESKGWIVKQEAMEELRLSQQLERWNEADLVIGSHGAGLTNVLFMRPGSTLVEIFPYGFYDRLYGDMSSLVSVKYRNFSATQEGQTNALSEYPKDCPISLDDCHASFWELAKGSAYTIPFCCRLYVLRASIRLNINQFEGMLQNIADG